MNQICISVITDFKHLEFTIQKKELSVPSFWTHIRMFLRYLHATGRSGFIMCTVWKQSIAEIQCGFIWRSMIRRISTFFSYHCYKTFSKKDSWLGTFLWLYLLEHITSNFLIIWELLFYQKEVSLAVINITYVRLNILSRKTFFLNKVAISTSDNYDN